MEINECSQGWSGVCVVGIERALSGCSHMAETAVDRAGCFSIPATVPKRQKKGHAESAGSVVCLAAKQLKRCCCSRMVGAKGGWPVPFVLGNRQLPHGFFCSQPGACPIFVFQIRKIAYTDTKIWP